MKILAIDSSTDTSSVAVLDDDKLIAINTITVKITHSETLLPMIKDLLFNAKMNLDEIDVFAVTIGPGSFTGIRIGIATVKGLAFGRGKKCVEVSTLDAIYENIKEFDGIICPVINARRGQVYASAYLDGKKIIEEQCIQINDLANLLRKYDKDVYFAGDGYELTDSIDVRRGETPVILRQINAYSVGKIAYRKVIDGEYVKDSELRANYLRKSQAEMEREEKLRGEKSQ